ncbi:hypothetical protein BRADI_3g35614v3, partial [Brachypodium distachyon]
TKHKLNLQVGPVCQVQRPVQIAVLRSSNQSASAVPSRSGRDSITFDLLFLAAVQVGGGLLQFTAAVRTMVSRNSVLSQDDFTLEAELKMLNKPYVKSFKDNYGVVFDCVDIHKQPAFDHPLLKNHKLQIPPSSSAGTGLGLPTTSGESCPYGTVPIRRTLKEDLVRRRASSQVMKPQTEYTSTIEGQHFAQVLFDSEKGSLFVDVKADIDVYPLVIPPGQKSTAQILVVDRRPSSATVVQAGWHIDSQHEGDNQPRFMVYWTADGYQKTGCLNYECPGFVVTSQATTPGMALPVGKITLKILRVIHDIHHISLNNFIFDFQTGNWNVYLNGEMVGYFPGAIVNGMDGSTQIQMGGTVYSTPGEGKSPPMGNGILAADTNAAAKFTWVVMRGSKTINYMVAKDIDSSIYDAVVTSASEDGPQGFAFVYGGPGGV